MLACLDELRINFTLVNAVDGKQVDVTLTISFANNNKYCIFNESFVPVVCILCV